MLWLSIITFFILSSVSFTKEPDTALTISKITVYSFSEIRNDDIVERKVYLQFKVYKSDSLILSVGEFYDKPAEISLPLGKYRFSFFTDKGWKDFEIEIISENSVFYFSKLVPNSRIKQ